MMSSTSRTSSSAMLAERSLRIRTRPDDSVDVPPYDETSIRSIRTGTVIARIRSAMNGSEPLSTLTRGQLAAGVVGADPRPELPHLGLDLLLRDEDLGDVGLEIDRGLHALALACSAGTRSVRATAAPAMMPGADGSRLHGGPGVSVPAGASVATTAPRAGPARPSRPASHQAADRVGVLWPAVPLSSSASSSRPYLSIRARKSRA